MKRALFNTYMSYSKKAKKLGRQFFNDERGVSPIVATVLIILITVVLALLVSDKLRDWVTNILDKFINRSNNL